jgi:hypothetical protein
VGAFCFFDLACITALTHFTFSIAAAVGLDSGADDLSEASQLLRQNAIAIMQW